MSLRRELGPFDATMVVIGGIIGTGIFVNPYLVARTLHSSPLVLAAWVTGGAVALVGAFAYAELGRRLPKAGGPYVYLRDAWHPLAGFLYGWALLWMIETGAMAAVALNFARYTLQLVGQPEGQTTAVAVGAIVVLSAINYVGVKPGSRVLNVLVVLKGLALGSLFVFAWWGASVPGWWHASASTTPAAGAPSGVLAFGIALVPIFFTYGGWQNANYVAEEMRQPARDLPRALIVGTLIVIAVYLLANVAYLRALGIDGLAATVTPAAAVAGAWLGPAGARFMAATIAISTFGFLDLAILAPPRVYYAMAQDGMFFTSLGRLHPRFQTPGAAIVVQSIWAVGLLLTGRYEDLVNTVTFADWIFFGLTVAGLFVLRRRDPDAPGFRTPGYPWLPAAFVLVAFGVVISTVEADPVRSAVGAGLLALGVPVYFAFRAHARRRAGTIVNRGQPGPRH